MSQYVVPSFVTLHTRSGLMPRSDEACTTATAARMQGSAWKIGAIGRIYMEEQGTKTRSR